MRKRNLNISKAARWVRMHSGLTVNLFTDVTNDSFVLCRVEGVDNLVRLSADTLRSERAVMKMCKTFRAYVKGLQELANNQPTKQQPEQPVRTIYKYPLELKSTQTLQIRNGSIPLHVGKDPQGFICLWCEVHEHALNVPAVIHMVGTGQPLPNEAQMHIGSITVGEFVWHFYL